MTVSVNKFRTSKDAEDALRGLHKRLGLPFNLLCRLAWSRSLREAAQPDVDHLEITGKEFNRYSLTGEYDGLMKALTVEHAGSKLSDEDFFGRFFKVHVDRGLVLLEKELATSNSADEAWSHLLRGIPAPLQESSQTGALTTRVINLAVGEEVGSGDPVICSINTATNPHMAIVGIPGSGKTQFVKKILADVRKGYPDVNFLFLDYAKGDVAGDQKFVAVTGARVFKLPARTMPVNPFILDSYDRTSVRFSAEEKVESIDSYEHLGPVQKGLLSKAIEAAYVERASEDLQFPDFEIVERQLRRLYEEEGRSDDTLTETLRKLTSFHLFPTISESSLLGEPLAEQTLIIDLHELPALRELVAFFVIEKLYRELKNAPEAEVDSKTGARRLRSLLVIDEAHNYLPMNNIFLEKLIREMRSKGLGIVLLSQSPDDFDQ